MALKSFFLRANKKVEENRDIYKERAEETKKHSARLAEMQRYVNMSDERVRKQIEEITKSDGNRLVEACNAFRSGIAFNMVNDVILQKRSFKQEERDVVVHDINLYFANPIAALRNESGKLGQQDISLIFCTLLGFDQEVIADIMCTSRSNMRSIKSRLKSKISAETFALYFKE